MNQFSYETTDWEAEALRIGRAFDTEKPCEFIEKSGLYGRWRELVQSGSHQTCITKDGYDLTVIYGHEIRRFYITLSNTWWIINVRDAYTPGPNEIDDTAYFHIQAEEERRNHDVDCASIEISWDGSLVMALPFFIGSKKFIHDYGTPMVKALLYLDLLNEKIEQAMKVSVTAHQKIEWIAAHDKKSNEPAKAEVKQQVNDNEQ